MRILSTTVLFVGVLSALLLTQCDRVSSEDKSVQKEAPAFAGFESQVKWGEHLVTVSACHDCHSPKKMTEQGMEIDTALLLSGHPSQMAAVDVNRQDMETKGIIATSDLTSWVGSWGVSYTANLTPDATGIGNWTETQFIKAIREGKSKGLDGTRPLLPPMPWQNFKKLNDEDLRSIYAYLKTTTPVKNIVPSPIPLKDIRFKREVRKV